MPIFGNRVLEDEEKKVPTIHTAREKWPHKVGMVGMPPARKGQPDRRRDCGFVADSGSRFLPFHVRFPKTGGAVLHLQQRHLWWISSLRSCARALRAFEGYLKDRSSLPIVVCSNIELALPLEHHTSRKSVYGLLPTTLTSSACPFWRQRKKSAIPAPW